MGDRTINPGEFYRHFKGNLYQIIAIGTHADSGERQVVYQALYGDYQVYIRDYSSFISIVDQSKYPSSEQQYRFEKVPASELVEKPKSEETKHMITESVVPSDCEGEINPDLLEFLEADSNEEKIEVLYRIRKRIDDAVMTAIEASLDISNTEGSIEDRVMFVRNNLATRVKYEGSRLR